MTRSRVDSRLKTCIRTEGRCVGTGCALGHLPGRCETTLPPHRRRPRSLRKCLERSERGRSAPGSFGAPEPQESGASQQSFVGAGNRPIGDIRGPELIAPKRPFVLVPMPPKVPPQHGAHEGMRHAKRSRRSKRLEAARVHHFVNLTKTSPVAAIDLQLTVRWPA